MSYFTVEDFRIGVDRRRPARAGTPGALIVGENGHITRGGDFEGRKEFTPDISLPPGTHGLAGLADTLFVFGSDPEPSGLSGVTYQRLEHPFNATMTDVLDYDSFDGKLYVVAEFDDGSVHHFYDGTFVTDWHAGRVVAGMTNLDGVAAHLRDLINADDDAAVTATASGTVVTLTGKEDTAFEIEASATDGGSADDQTAVVATPTPAIEGIEEVLSSAAFSITGGTNNTGINIVSSIKIDGIEVLGAAVDWEISNSATATNVAAQITNNVSSPEYTAEADGQVVTILAAAGTGASANGKTVSITVAGDVTVDKTSTTTADGVTVVPGQEQVSTVTLGGSFDEGDRFTIPVDERPYGYNGSPDTPGRTAKTFKQKVYSTGGSLLNFCGVNKPLGWNYEDSRNVGAGFINFSNEIGGSENLIAAAVYQKKLALFAKNAIAIEIIDVDELQNKTDEVLENTGTLSPRSVAAYGNNDVFYLHSTGVRSLRARANTDSPFVSDVGIPIDKLWSQLKKSLTEKQIERAASVIDPEDGRYWLAVGDTILVFSFFVSPKISAWTTYKPGIEVEHFAVVNERVYCRSGDTVYLYGGPDGETYPAAGVAPVVAQLPFMHGGQAATRKSLMGIDLASDGVWQVDLLVRPELKDEELENDPGVSMGLIEGTTYGNPDIGGEIAFTHVAPRLTCSAGGYCSISQITVHYDLDDAG